MQVPAALAKVAARLCSSLQTTKRIEGTLSRAQTLNENVSRLSWTQTLRKDTPTCWYLLEVLLVQAPSEPLPEPQLHFIQTQLQEVVDQGDLEPAGHRGDTRSSSPSSSHICCQ